MTQLFATHCTQKGNCITIKGQYDAEQELWVGDDQPQGASLRTINDTGTHSSSTPSHYVIYTKIPLGLGGFYTIEDGSGTDSDPYASDTDQAPD